MTEDKNSIAVVSEFVRKAMYLEDVVYVGIDPGQTGAIGLLCRRLHAVVDIPTMITAVKRSRKIKEPVVGGPKTRTVAGKATLFDYGAIIALFRQLRPVADRVVVSLEIAQVQVAGGPGRNSIYTGYKTGFAYGIWPLFLASKYYVLEEIKPNVWKQKMGLAGKDKEAARAKALALWPKAALNRKKDHNRAEAMLLAEFCRREREGGRGC